MKYLKTYHKLNEGLISSWSYSIFFNKLFDLMGDFDLNRNDMGIHKGIYVFFDRVDLTKKFISKFYDLLNVAGYHVANYYIKTDDGDLVKQKNGKPLDKDLYKDRWNIQFHLNKKFDDVVDEYVRYLYHVTEDKYLRKIKKSGLIPHSRQKIEYHPDRIYVFDEEDNAKDFIDLLDKNKKYSILKIDRDKIKYELKLYNDPKFFTPAFYTYENIPPYSIID